MITFADAVASGESYSDAYRAAYSTENYKNTSIWTEASKLMSNPLVLQRIEEARSIARERAAVTIESLTRELDEDRALARQEGQASAAIKAVEIKGKLHGQFEKDNSQKGASPELQRLLQEGWDKENT